MPTTALVRADSSSAMQLQPAELSVEVNGREAPVSSVVPVRREGAEAAILIDDGLRGGFGTQLKELRQFINGLPPNVQVLVGYMQNGTVRDGSKGFTSDHQAAAKALRIPLSSPGISGSPYFCLQDFVKHWPGKGDAARFVLMITNGVDLYNGSVSPLNQNSPYVQTAQEDAQRANVAVYSIYYGDAGIRGGFANFSGQSYLSQVAAATGGVSFYQGRITPPSISPYLKQFQAAISESYLVTFPAPSSGRKKTLLRLKIRSTQPGMKIAAPDSVQAGSGSSDASDSESLK